MEIDFYISQFKEEVEKARNELIKTHGREIKKLDIELALAMRFNLSHYMEIVQQDLNAEQIVDLLKNYDFRHSDFTAWLNKISKGKYRA